MKHKLLSLMLLSLCAAASGFTTVASHPNEYVDVTYVNPCQEVIVFGYADKDAGGASTTMTVDPGKSRTVSMPKGSFVKYTTKQWSYYKTLGQASGVKGQQFTCPCNK